MQRTILGTLCALSVMPTFVAGFNFAGPALMHQSYERVHRGSSAAPKQQTQRHSTSVELADEAIRLPMIARGVFEEDTRPVLLYDGVCNMCNGFVNLFLDLDQDEKFRFSALQSPTGRALLDMSGRSPDDISSIVLVEANGRAHIQSDALLRMGRLLGGPVGLVLFPGVIVPKFVRDKMYDTVADNRYSFLGKREDCRCSDERYAHRFL